MTNRPKDKECETCYGTRVITSDVYHPDKGNTIKYCPDCTPPDRGEIDKIKDWIETTLDAEAHGQWIRCPSFKVLEDVAYLLAPQFVSKLAQAKTQAKKSQYDRGMKELDDANKLSGAPALLQRVAMKEAYRKTKPNEK